ncbi:hypothetical protein ACFVS2_26125 [Brevibacillus sp. NPDC058079]|uniref:hypothetical protein n=1 Tax=Brevibacillus sp. NPDC058079 TaxID=3346330 RepID=UPI0036E8E3C0
MDKYRDSTENNGNLKNHDELLHAAYDKYDPFYEKCKQEGILIGWYVRSMWLKTLPGYERAAVQLANLNRQMENGGLGGWYQDGQIYVQDIDDLIELAKIGVDQKIDGFDFFLCWLTDVKVNYLPAINHYISNLYKEEKVELFNEEPLNEEYFAWSNRLNQFERLLIHLQKVELKIY